MISDDSNKIENNIPGPAFVFNTANEAPKRVYTVKDRVLLPIALLTGVLFDRLVSSGLNGYLELTVLWSIFWLCYLIIYYALFWEKVKGNKTSWLVASFTALLCVWNFIFEPNGEYGALTFFVIPWVLMAHAVYSVGDTGLKQAGQLAVEWFAGWLVKPFAAIPHFFGSCASLTQPDKNKTLKKVLIGAGVVLPLMLVLLPLLSGADMVFSYYMRRLFNRFELGPFFLHTVVSLVASILFYSFFWNLREHKKIELKDTSALRLDSLICAIVLGSALLVYAVFCAVQFVYLFAGAGLPEGLTYSEYAREGFWQLIAVAGINLFMFGVFLQFVQKSRWFYAMLAGLIAATALLLSSAAVRLWLYIDAYGLTWLRLISAWFIIYLAAAIALSAVRMAKEKLPLIAVCAITLLVWFTILGYSNPDWLIESYNLAAGEA